MFKQLVVTILLTLQALLVVFKIAIADNVSWWIIFFPMYGLIFFIIVSGFIKAFKK